MRGSISFCKSVDLKRVSIKDSGANNELSDWRTRKFVKVIWPRLWNGIDVWAVYKTSHCSAQTLDCCEMESTLIDKWEENWIYWSDDVEFSKEISGRELWIFAGIIEVRCESNTKRDLFGEIDAYSNVYLFLRSRFHYRQLKWCSKQSTKMETLENNKHLWVHFWPITRQKSCYRYQITVIE